MDVSRRLLHAAKPTGSFSSSVNLAFLGLGGTASPSECEFAPLVGSGGDMKMVQSERTKGYTKDKVDMSNVDEV